MINIYTVRCETDMTEGMGGKCPKMKLGITLISS